MGLPHMDEAFFVVTCVPHMAADLRDWGFYDPNVALTAMLYGVPRYLPELTFGMESSISKYVEVPRPLLVESSWYTDRVIHGFRALTRELKEYRIHRMLIEKQIREADFKMRRVMEAVKLFYFLDPGSVVFTPSSIQKINNGVRAVIGVSAEVHSYNWFVDADDVETQSTYIVRNIYPGEVQTAKEMVEYSHQQLIQLNTLRQAVMEVTFRPGQVTLYQDEPYESREDLPDEYNYMPLPHMRRTESRGRSVWYSTLTAEF